MARSTHHKSHSVRNLKTEADHRARSVFELAVNQPRLDMPELLWKQYIDFEVEQEEYDKARLLYKNLLSKTNHVKVWLSLAQFEIQTEEESQGSNISRWVERNFHLRPSLLTRRLMG